MKTPLRIRHILAPTDFSAAAERALAMALELAGVFDARVTLLHVWSMPYTAYAEGLTWPLDEMERAARSALDRTLANAREVHPKVEALLREDGDWAQILEVANERDVDLIVMGTHGRRGLPHFVLGSVAEKVVRLSPVPVLTVKDAPME